MAFLGEHIRLHKHPLRVIHSGETRLAVSSRRRLHDRVRLPQPNRHRKPIRTPRGIPHPLRNQNAERLQAAGETGPQDFLEIFDGVIDSLKPTVNQLEEIHGIKINPLRGIQASERLVYWTEDGSQVLKVDYLPVPPKQAEERIVTSNLVGLLMLALGDNNVPVMFDSGIKKFTTPEGQPTEYSYIIQEAIPSLEEQGESKDDLLVRKVPVHGFEGSLKRLASFGIVLDIPEVEKVSNFVTTVHRGKQAEVHQPYIDNLWLEAENFLNIDVIKGIEKILDRVKDKRERDSMRLLIGAHVQRLFQISHKYGDIKQKEKNMTLLNELGVGEYAEEILTREITIYPGPSPIQKVR